MTLGVKIFFQGFQKLDTIQSSEYDSSEFCATGNHINRIA